MENCESKHRVLLFETVNSFIFAALEAREDATFSRQDFDRGRLMTYLEVFSMITKHADTLAIDPKEIGLDGIDIERDLFIHPINSGQ